MAVFTYSYSNSLGETFSSSTEGHLDRIKKTIPSVVNSIEFNLNTLAQYVFSSTNSDTGSTIVNKTFNKTVYSSTLSNYFILNQYDNYSTSESDSSYFFTFIKENSETENIAVYNSTINNTYSYTDTRINWLPYAITSADVSFSNREYYRVLQLMSSDMSYLMANGINASITMHLLWPDSPNYTCTNYNVFRLISIDENQYTAAHTDSFDLALSSTALLTATSTTNIDTASSSSRHNNTDIFSYFNQGSIEYRTYTYRTSYNTNYGGSIWQYSGSSISRPSDIYTTIIRRQRSEDDLFRDTAIPFKETTIDTMLYNSDGYLQGYKIAGSAKGDANGYAFLFFGTSILDTYISTPWNSVIPYGAYISTVSHTVYYEGNDTNVISYKTSTSNDVVTDENGITESVTSIRIKYVPEVSYLAMNWMGTSYIGHGTQSVTTSSYVSSYAFSNAENCSSIILESAVNGDLYEYYTTYITYKCIKDVTTYDSSAYVESAVKTTYSETTSRTTYLYDYNGSYNTETRYDSYASSQDYTTTRTETIFTDSMTSSFYSYISITYVSSKFGHGINISTMKDISSSSIKSFSVSKKNGYTMLDSSMYHRTTSEKKDISVIETRLSQQVKTYSTESVISNSTTYYNGPYGTVDNSTVLMECGPVTFSGSFILSDGYNSLSTTTSYYNTTDFGTTFRNSSMVSSTEIVNINNEYLNLDRIFSYNITSAWAYDTVISTISKYSTVLQTTFKISYDTRTNYNSYSYTNIATTTAYGTEDRFINLVGISRVSSYTVYITNTVAYYDGSTMATLTSMSTDNGPSISSSSSVLNYTFITSIDDYSSSTDLASTESSSLANKQFMNSITQLVSSTMEQQNDTLIFKSEIATYSTYRLSTSFSTSSTINVNYEATTYTDEYNPISYTTTSMAVTTSLSVDNSIESATASSTITQAVNYTPIYSSVNGVYLTTN